MASTSTARPGPGPTEDLLLPGSIPLSKEAIVSALAKASVGKADKKKGVLLSLTEMRDTLLAKVGEVSQDQKTTLERWIPESEREVRNHRFRASDVAEHLYEISIVFDAYINGKPITRAPTVPNCLPVYYQCHCFQQQNIRSDGSDQGSTCQIKCTVRLYVPGSLQGWFASSHFDSSSATKTHG